MNNVKYQYIRPEKYDMRQNGLCITIGTEIVDSEKKSHIFYAIALKNPKDKFDKVIAREIVNNNFKVHDFVSGELIYNKGEFTRHNIVVKILMDLYINSSYLTRDYQEFVRDLLYQYYLP